MLQTCDDKSALKYSSLSPCCSWYNCLCDGTLNCVWESLHWWHGFTFYRRGRDDCLGIGTSSAGSSGDGVAPQNPCLVGQWGQAWELIDNCKMSFCTLCYQSAPALAGRPLPAHLYLCFSLAALECTPPLLLSCVKSQDQPSCVPQLNNFYQLWLFRSSR